MNDKELEEKVKAMTFWSGKNSMTIEDMATIQHKEIIGLFEMGAFMRPKHEAAINQYLAENWKPLEATIEQKDFAAFDRAFQAAIESANAYHELKEKPYIYWKLPDSPPPDLDLRPRGAPKK